MQKQMIIAVIVTAIVFGGAGFALGKHGAAANAVGQSENGAGRTFGNAVGGNRTGGRFAGGGVVSGQILSKDADSITVEMRGGALGQSGGSKIILLSSSTQVMKAAQGSVKDLSIGDQVTAMGTANSDGSMTAQSVQIRPHVEGRGTSTPETAQ